jgi:glucosamine--fructose-6-phosphate aminotransferase (isomerizing)
LIFEARGNLRHMADTQMAAEMREQPAVIAALVERRRQAAEALRGALPSPPAGTILIGRGSSDNAAIYGRYLIELVSGRPVVLAAPSLLTLYGAKVDYRGWLAVAVSQSGRTPEIATVLERLQEAGACGVALTSDAESPLGARADVVLELAAGEEKAVPATKTVTAELVLFALIASALGDAPWAEGDLERLPEAVAWVLADEDRAQAAAARLAGASGIACVARGLLYAAALETALKIKETALVLAEGYSGADFRHGPIAAATREVGVLAMLAPGPAYADTQELVALLRERGVQVTQAGPAADDELPLPGHVPEALAAIPAVVRGQQVAHALAQRLGLDPDAPAGLSKVTATT